MAIYTFGAGSIYAIGLTDASGNAISAATSTPIKIMTLQSMSLDVKFDTKKVYGENQFAEYVAGGKGELKGKFTNARVNGKAVATLLGRTATTGTMSKLNNDTTGTLIPASSPYTITPTPANSGTIADDLGVLNASGVPMTKVTGTPTTGQYAYSAGVYTFAAADAGLRVFTNYRYTYTLASASKIAVVNLAMGSLPTFKLFCDVKSPNGKNATVTLHSVTCPSLQAFDTKQDDFGMMNTDFEAFQNSSGDVADWYIEE